MEKTVVIVNPYFVLRSTETDFPTGAYVIKQLFESNGIEARVLDLNKRISEIDEDLIEESVQEIVSEDPDYVGFRLMPGTGPHTVLTAKKLKKEFPEIEIFSGGPLATIAGREIIESFEGISFLVKGEAEKSFPELSGYIQGSTELEQIPNIVYRDEQEVKANISKDKVSSEEICLLETVNSNDYELYYLEGGRGCPYQCDFCSNSSLTSSEFRPVGPERLRRQIERFYDNGAESFLITHDLFTQDKERVMEFCDRVEDLDIEWTCFSRADTLDRELIDKMDRAGCKKYLMGIETWDQDLQYEINKNLDLDETQDTIDYIQDETGIKISSSFLIGFPQGDLDTLNSTIEKTVKYQRKGLDICLTVVKPLQVSPMYRRNKDSLEVFDAFYKKDWSGALKDIDEATELIRNHPDIFYYYYRIENDKFNKYHLDLIQKVMKIGLENFPEAMDLLIEKTDHKLIEHINKAMEWNSKEITREEYLQTGNAEITKKMSNYLFSQGGEIRESLLEPNPAK